MIKEPTGDSIHHRIIKELSRPVLEGETSKGTTNLVRPSILDPWVTTWTPSSMSLAINVGAGDMFRGNILGGWAHLYNPSLDVRINENNIRDSNRDGSSSARLRQLSRATILHSSSKVTHCLHCRLNRATICHRRSRDTTTCSNPRLSTLLSPHHPCHHDRMTPEEVGEIKVTNQRELMR